jgi:hydroxymethylglutaryl-CoA reductase (NADPH)
MSGSMGFNGHYANIVAAVFLATGQDMAHVVEGSLGMTTAEVIDDGDLYFSVYLPDLMVGTVGGGTGLATQQEALGILGFDKGKKGDALQLAGVIGGAVLAGELSLTAALASGDLARAHQKFGRGK